MNPLRDAVVGAGYGPPERTAPDFIARTRPRSVDYLPVGVSAPARPTTAKSAAEVEALTTRLDQSRTANETEAATARKLGATPPPAPVKVEPLPPTTP